MLDQGFAGLGLVGSCRSIRGIVADHLVELMECGQGSACAKSYALRAPCFHLLSGKGAIDELVGGAVHNGFKGGETWIVGHCSSWSCPFPLPLSICCRRRMYSR